MQTINRIKKGDKFPRNIGKGGFIIDKARCDGISISDVTYGVYGVFISLDDIDRAVEEGCVETDPWEE